MIGVMRVALIPGLAVSRYARPAVAALRGRGIDARLLAAPGGPTGPVDVRVYGHQLAQRLDGDTDVLIGLSVGSQVAAVAAATADPSRLRRVVLISPTVDPAARRATRLVLRWLAGGRREPLRLAREQVPDWTRAGPQRLAGGIRSALQVHIEDLLPQLDGRLTVVHAERDVITSHAYAAQLAAGPANRLCIVPDATHSWPFGDEDRFAAMIEEQLRP
jgi:pimeloyl-ACP methyl ester carboxylesterase